jgi:TatD DNase family protein
MIYIDIHTHISNLNTSIISIQNIFHSQTLEISSIENHFYSVGIHPWHTQNINADDVNLVKKAAENKNVIAIGECGIDKLKGADIKSQIGIFIEQSKIAEEIGKPLIIHCVKAYDEIIALRKQLKPTVPWIIHDFRKNIQLAQQMISLGFKLSFGRIIKYNDESFKKLLINLPDNSYFFESDDDDADIKDYYKISAEIKNISIEALAERLKINFAECFKIEINA